MIFVTGITGHSGTWFLKALIREGGIANQKIRCLVRPTSDTRLLDTCGLNIETVTGEIEDPVFLRGVMQTEPDDPLTVLHIAGIGKSLPIIKAALENDARRLILVHTTGIYSKYKKASADYLKIEQEIETHIKGKNINVNILRPTMIYGSMSDYNVSVFIRMIDRLKIFPVVSGGANYLQPVHARDLGEAYYHILIKEESTKNKNYDLSGGAPITMMQMFKIISKGLKRNNLFISVPFPIAYACAWILYILSLTKADFRERVQRMVEDRCYPHDEARRDFGYDPMPFNIGIRDELNEFFAKKL